MRRLLSVIGVGLLALSPSEAVAERTLSDKQFLRTLDDRASSCVNFAAVAHLANYNSDHVEEIISAACDEELLALDEEACRQEGLPPEETVACIDTKSFSYLIVGLTVNLLKEGVAALQR